MRDSFGRFVKGFRTRPKTSVVNNCLVCDKQFESQPHRAKSGRGKYCSKSCSGKIAFKISIEKSDVLLRKGKKHPSNSGSNCHFWKGGVTPIHKSIIMSAEYRAWRESVFKRDNYTCLICLKTGGTLQADHIKSFSLYPQFRLDLDNGRTLCLECHKKTDNYAGKSHKKQLEGYKIKLESITIGGM